MLKTRFTPHLRAYCIMAILLVAVVLPLLIPTQTVRSAVNGWVTRNGTQLMLNGQPFRAVGPNIVWLGLDEVANQDPISSVSPDFPSTYRVDDALDTVLAMGGNVIRSHTLGISYGCANGAGNGGVSNGKCMQPSPGVYNEEAFRHVDYAIYAAGQRGIRLIIPLVDEYQMYFHGGIKTFTDWRGKAASEFYTDAGVLIDFKAWISKLLNRVNTYTNVRYKDDPTIMAWETGNELRSTSAWTAKIAYHLRTEDTRHLIIDGAYGINANSLSIPDVDIYSDHFYPMSIAKLNSDAATVQAAGKAFFVGEYAWRPNPSDPPGDTLPNFLTAIENSTAIGDVYWALFPHRGNYAYMNHSDGNISYTVHYPGDPGDIYMINSVQSLRTHAYKMLGISPIPAHRIPPAPEITDIWGGAQIFIRGAAGAHTYSVERGTSSTGPWTNVCDKCTSAMNSWTDPTYPGSGVTVWYRAQGHNGDGVGGPFSAPYKAASAKPTATATLWPTIAASPTFGPPTASFTPSNTPVPPTSTPIASGTFYRGININGGPVTIEGNLWKSQADAINNGFWVGPEAIPDTKSLTPNPATDTDTRSMLNSLVYTPTDLHFRQTIDPGNYQIYVWTMENWQSNVRSWNLNLEGITVGRELGNLAMNQWAKYGPFNTSVSDGTLNIDLIHVSANPMLMGLAIYKTSTGPTNTPCTTCTPTITPSLTKTNTPIPPTATKTNTPVPPTATKTNTPGVTFVPPTNTPAGPTATPTNTPIPSTATKTNTPVTGGTNIAPSGTGYTWYNITTSYAGNQRTEPGVNNGNLTAFFPLTGSGDDNTNVDEAAGVIWSTTQNITSVKYYSGTCDQYDNGPFTGNIRVQFSTNGTTWTTDSAWTVSPAYPYDSCTSAGQPYTLSGPTKTGVKGVRVIGIVHSTNSSLSWHANANEVQVFN
jgi:hypothetical protein